MNDTQSKTKAEFDIPGLLQILETVLAGHEKPVALHEPLFEGREWEYVKDCIDTGWVSSAGSYVPKFESLLADFCGVKHAVATSNGTSALHVALELCGVTKDTKVLTPSLTFIATANAVSYCGATPHFVDISPDTLGMDPLLLEQYLANIAVTENGATINKHTGKKISAILPVHTLGHPVDMDPLRDLANRYAIPVIEDAAESIGSLYKDRPAGSLGKMAAVSFNGNKTVTTGGGGAILTNDAALAQKAKHITTTAKKNHAWAFDHDAIGYNYRMPNINAALGCAQLESLPDYVKAKRQLAQFYQKAFENFTGARFFSEPAHATSNYWLNAILLDDASMALRDDLLDILNREGYQCRPIWTLMHKLPMYKDCPKANLDNAENVESRLINIPSSVKLGRADD